MTARATSENLVNALFHTATTSYESQIFGSKRVFEEECRASLTYHKYRLKSYKKTFEKTVAQCKEFRSPLLRLINFLDKNQFKLTAAELVKTRFIVSLKRQEINFKGLLTFHSGPDYVSLEVFKDINRKDTCVCVVHAAKKNVVHKNTFLKGMIKSIELGGTNEREI